MPLPVTIARKVTDPPNVDGLVSEDAVVVVAISLTTWVVVPAAVS